MIIFTKETNIRGGCLKTFELKLKNNNYKKTGHLLQSTLTETVTKLSAKIHQHTLATKEPMCWIYIINKQIKSATGFNKHQHEIKDGKNSKPY